MLWLTLKIFALHVILILLIAAYPWNINFNPQEFEISVQQLEGGLSQNNLLESVELLHKGMFLGPESLDIHDGVIYTGVYGGYIIAIQGNEVRRVARIGKDCKGFYDQEICGRVLGLRISFDGSRLLVVDAYYGLYLVEIEDGETSLLVPQGSNIGGTKLGMINDVATDKGIIYFTESSSKYPLHKIVWSVLEHENSGRVFSYNPLRQDMQVLITGLTCPNGIQLTHDGKALLIAETGKFRILRYYLEGPKKGTYDVFAQNLPGDLDNIRKSSSGGYWVAFVNGRPKRTIGDFVASYPLLRLGLGRVLHATGESIRLLANVLDSHKLHELASYFSNGWVLFDQMPKYGLIVELDANGAVKRSLHAPSGNITYISEVLEHNGHLYLGSSRNDFIGKLKLD